MRPILVCALVVSAIATPRSARAQSIVDFDASVAVGSSAQRYALALWLPLTDLAGAVRLQGGLRYTSYLSESGTYTNRGVTGANLTPTLGFSQGFHGLNLAVQVEASLVGPIEAGANLDLVGVVLGAEKSLSSVKASPQNLSLFLVGANDRGALNSEFFLAWRVAPLVALRAGVTHYVTNFDVSDIAVASAPVVKYQRFQTLPFVAVRWRF